MAAETPDRRRGPRTLGKRIAMGAGQLGVRVEEYARERAAGLKWCTGCKAWQSMSEFAPATPSDRRHRTDPVHPVCRVYERNTARERMRRLRSSKGGR